MDQSKTEKRPWGQFTTFDEQTGGRGNEGYKVKRIEVDAGKRLSLQSHYNREEHWIVVRGRGVVTLDFGDGKEELFQQEIVPGKHLKIKAQQKHRVEAISDLVFIEVQLGHCDEDDIVRYHDDYGRAKQ